MKKNRKFGKILLTFMMFLGMGGYLYRVFTFAKIVDKIWEEETEEVDE